MNLKQNLVAAATTATMAFSLLAPFALVHAAAVDTSKYLKPVAAEAGYSTTDPESALPKTIGKIINVGLSMLGLIFLVLALYAGFKWMTSGGESKGVDEAKGTLKNAVIGLIITLSAYGISTFVMTELVKTTMGP